MWSSFRRVDDFPVTCVLLMLVQVQDCIQQNTELRATLNQLRLEQSSMVAATDGESAGTGEASAGDEGPGNKTAADSWQVERTKLKVTTTFMKCLVLEEYIYIQQALSI